LYIRLKRRTDAPPSPLLRQPLTPKENLAYYRISNHYKFILGVMFDCLQYKKAIILEVGHTLSLPTLRRHDSVNAASTSI
jgi:hypothetical protein